MSAELTYSIQIDDRLESYRTFFDHTWSISVYESVQGTKLERPVFALCLNWKAAANTFILPWLMMQNMEGFANGFMEKDEPNGVALVRALMERLCESVDGISPMKRARLRTVVERLYEKVKRTNEDARLSIDISSLWSDLVNAESAEFRLSLWGSQRICYGSLYHAYENFVRQCVAVAKGNDRYDAFRIKELLSDLEGLFGREFVKSAVFDKAVHIAREVRHVLAHNGGKVTSTLESMDHGLIVQDDMIQILAEDTRNLFGVLRDRVSALVAATLALPTTEDAGPS